MFRSGRPGRAQDSHGNCAVEPSRNAAHRPLSGVEKSGARCRRPRQQRRERSGLADQNKASGTCASSWRRKPVLHRTATRRLIAAANATGGSTLWPTLGAQHAAKTPRCLRANDLLLCVRHRVCLRIAAASTALSPRFSATGERIPVKRRFFSVVSSFPYWRRAAVALHFALPTGSADPTPPTITEHITHGKNRR